MIDVAFATALALEAHTVEAQRIEDVRPTVDVRQYLHPKQRDVFECDAPAMNVLGGRQGGKTFVDIGWLFEGAFEKPGSLNVYFALTRPSAMRIAWPEVMAWAKLLELDADALSEHSLTVRLPNGSTIVLVGTDDQRTIETWRGVKANRVVIDEMGAQPNSFIEYFVALLWPTLIKNRGRMLRSGNPGLVKFGYWFDQTGDQRRPGAPLFHWTAWDNPALGTTEDVDAFVDTFLHDAKLDRESATFLREWKAQWVDDAGALVYPLDRALNIVDALPTKTPTGIAIDPTKWRHVVSADVGWVDASAFTVLAAHPMIADDYVLRSFKRPALDHFQFMEVMRELRAEFRPVRMRVDMGGVGKGYAEVCKRHGVPVEAAEKTDKRSNVRLYRDRLIAGRIKFIDGECNPLFDEMARLGWDERKELPKDSAECRDDACDSALYGERDLHNYRDTYEQPVDNSPAARATAQEAAWIAARMKAASRTNSVDRTRAAYARR